MAADVGHVLPSDLAKPCEARQRTNWRPLIRLVWPPLPLDVGPDFSDRVSNCSVRHRIGETKSRAWRPMPRKSWPTPSLLMPAELIFSHLKQYVAKIVQTDSPLSRDDLITQLARTFDVSTEAMCYRQINLGILAT